MMPENVAMVFEIPIVVHIHIHGELYGKFSTDFPQTNPLAQHR